ncbi:GTPase activating protein for Arf protein [Toxoplasma gondii TgCatPRC2]|uniref:GTPase activating protein for Arf protein n=1 Tax=Toxoplasma gondii TgCatPRC2 TaxID=1130821 RepID=A0A151HLA1_TOXGO|nr:GTPase activating protein for Arf protein [Toxoplasma gondii TgCatPRC2]
MIFRTECLASFLYATTRVMLCFLFRRLARLVGIKVPYPCPPCMQETVASRVASCPLVFLALLLGLPASLGAGLGPFPAATVGCGGPSSGTSPEWPENAPPTNPAAPWPGAWPAASQETVAHRGGGQALHATTLSSSFFPPAAPAAPSRNGVFFSSDASVSPSLGSAPVLGATRLETEQSRNGGVGAADSLAGGVKLGEVSLWNTDVSSPPKKDVFSSLNSLDAFALAGKVQARQKATPTAGVSTCCSGGTQLNGAKSDATFAGAGWLGVATPSPPAQAPGSSAEELLLI